MTDTILVTESFLRATPSRVLECWVQTHSGLPFDLLSPAPEQVSRADVLRHLSRIARYSGATLGAYGYTVAQHSILCADLVRLWGGDAALEREALLHDAPETYYGDITSPVQFAIRELHVAAIRETLAEVAMDFAYVERDSDDVADRNDGLATQGVVMDALMRFGARLAERDPLRELKARVDPVVRKVLGLADEEPALVKRADLVALAIEKKLVMEKCDRPWKLPELADTRYAILEPVAPEKAHDAFEKRLTDLDAQIERARLVERMTHAAV